MLYPFSRFLSPARSRPPCAAAARKKRRGFNLIESAIVLGVVGLVIGGIWVAADSVQQSQRINETSSGVIAICDQITNLYRSMEQPVINESLDSLLIETEIIPPSWSTSGPIFTPLSTNSRIRIYRYAGSGSDAPGDIGIHLLNIPKAYCPRLLSTINAKSNSAIKSVTIGIGWWTTKTTFRLPYSGDMSSPCNDGDLIHLQFTCYRK